MAKEGYEERYKEIYDKIVNEVDDKRREYKKAKQKLKDLIQEWSYAVMLDKYEKYIGKKVVIHYLGITGKERKTKVGYLKEFRWVANDTEVANDGLYPFLVKPKKDGSMSKQYFPKWDNTQAEVRSITKIEVVE